MVLCGKETQEVPCWDALPNLIILESITQLILIYMTLGLKLLELSMVKNSD